MNVEAIYSKELLAEGMQQSTTAVAILSLPTLTVKSANASFLRLSGQAIVGTPLLETAPELRNQVEHLVNHVVENREASSSCGTPMMRRYDGGVNTRYYDFICEPLLPYEKTEVDTVMLLAHDVTDLVMARMRWQAIAERHSLDESPVPMAVLKGDDHVIERTNEAMLSLWCRQSSDVANKRLFDVFPELTVQSIAELLKNVLATGTPAKETEILIYIEGSSCHYVDFELSPLRGGDGRILLTIYDVSDKVISRNKLRDNEERLRMLIEASGLGTWEMNLRTREFTYSDEYLASFGLKERLSHDELLQFMHPDDLPIRDKAFRRAFATGWLHYVSRLVWRDHSIHWLEAHGKVIYDEFGKPCKMMGTSRDITEEKLYEQSIQESEEKFRLLADSLPQFIWTGDANGNLNYFNKSVFDYSGLTFDELRGNGWIRIVHPEDRAANLRKWKDAVGKGEDFHFEHRFRRSDGLYRWQLSRATPQYDKQGRIQKWVGTSTDIHDQKTFAKDLEEKVLERTRELKETNEVLEKTNRELEQFAYIASHDLQEPLRKIQTFADILKKNIHDEVSVQKYFSKIDSSAQRMGDLIRSVLDYSRLPAHPGQLILTDLNEIIEKVRTDFELTIEDKGAIIECDHLPAIPGVPAQIHQLFSNIIGNALKFSGNKAHIRIKAAAFHGDQLRAVFNANNDKRYAEIRFSDNGIGFDRKYRDQIFTIFQRLHGWQQYSGTGIGLAICKKIVENHHGHITADGEPGVGSTFTVYLPA